MFLDSVWLPTSTKRKRLREVIKEFNKESHAANDKPAKDVVISFLKSKGFPRV